MHIHNHMNIYIYIYMLHTQLVRAYAASSLRLRGPTRTFESSMQHCSISCARPRLPCDGCSHLFASRSRSMSSSGLVYILVFYGVAHRFVIDVVLRQVYLKHADMSYLPARLAWRMQENTRRFKSHSVLDLLGRRASCFARAGPDLRDHPHSEDDHLDLLLVDRVPLAHRDDQLPGPRMVCLCVYIYIYTHICIHLCLIISV